MQIQLKQQEIEAALRQYIAQQGISLSGKEVKIAFTAKRNDSGLSADLSIDDVEVQVGMPYQVTPRTPVEQTVAAIAPAIATAIQEEESLIENDTSVASPPTASLFS